MFDDPREHANGHLPHAQDAEKLPIELAPVHDLLVATSEQWRAGLPAADRLAAFARSLPNVPGASDAQPDDDVMATRPEVPVVLPSRAPQRSRPLPAIAAAVTIAALLGGLLVLFAQSRIPDILQHPTVTATTPPTATEGVRPGFSPITGRWSLSTVQYGNLVVSMSNPNVLYRDGTQLERSDNGGQTWRTIATPHIPVTDATVVANSVSVMVGTQDPNTIVVSEAITLNSVDSTPCPADTRVYAITTHGGILASGGSGYCEQEFASRDGGANWQPVQIPGTESYNLVGAPHAGSYLVQQGRMLFATIPEQLPIVGPAGVRILTSTDGAHWQFADVALRAQAGSLCDFQPVPDGASIYAITLQNARNCVQGYPGVRQIWRSDDAGVSWNLVGSIKNRVVLILGVTRSPSGGTPLVYIGGTDSLVQESFRVHVSADGGITWQQAPTTGIPGSQQIFETVFGALGDGSIVEAFADRSVIIHSDDTPVTLTYYAWRRGDTSWRRVSPSLSIAVTPDTQYIATLANRMWVILFSHDNRKPSEQAYSYAA